MRIDAVLGFGRLRFIHGFSKITATVLGVDTNEKKNA